MKTLVSLVLSMTLISCGTGQQTEPSFQSSDANASIDDSTASTDTNESTMLCQTYQWHASESAPFEVSGTTRRDLGNGLSYSFYELNDDSYKIIAHLSDDRSMTPEILGGGIVKRNTMFTFFTPFNSHLIELRCN